MAKKKSIAGSLIPDTLIKTDDGGSYQPAIKIVEFYDPDFGPEPNDVSLSKYSGPRYGKKTLKELKDMCKDRDLTINGTKKILIDRLDEHNSKVKLEKEKKKEEGNKAIEASVKQKKKILNNRIRNLTRQRKSRLEQLIKAQQAFDGIEVEMSDIKVTLKSLDSLF